MISLTIAREHIKSRFAKYQHNRRDVIGLSAKSAVMAAPGDTA